MSAGKYQAALWDKAGVASSLGDVELMSASLRGWSADDLRWLARQRADIGTLSFKMGQQKRNIQKPELVDRLVASLRANPLAVQVQAQQSSGKRAREVTHDDGATKSQKKDGLPTRRAAAAAVAAQLSMDQALFAGSWNSELCRLTQRCMAAAAAAGLHAHEALAVASVAAKFWWRCGRAEVVDENVAHAALLVLAAKFDFTDNISPTSAIELCIFQEAVKRVTGVEARLLRAMEPRVLMMVAGDSGSSGGSAPLS